MNPFEKSRWVAICATSIFALLGGCSDDAAQMTPMTPTVPGGLLEACDAEHVCAEGLVCVDGKCESEQPSSSGNLGEDCDAKHGCVEGLICSSEGKCVSPDVDLCENVSCNDGQVCLLGKCLDSACVEDGTEKVCGDGQVCLLGKCLDSACVEDGTEKVCGDGQVCLLGKCLDSACVEDGTEKVCEDGLVCHVGECVYPVCVDKAACTTGKSCDETGTCIFDVAPALNAVPDGTQTDENGATVTVSLTLNNAPTKDVTVKCELSPEGVSSEAEVSCDGVLFHADNYDSAQTIYVIGKADQTIDDDFAYQLKVTTVSEDSDFSNLSQTIDLINKNVDVIGVQVVVDESGLTTTESGGSDTFDVVLSAKPESDVTITISSSNPELGEIEGATDNALTITFTPDNWDVPQTVTVVGKDDGEHADATPNKYQVVFDSVVSDDENYHGTTVDPIDVINIDNDIADAFFDKTEIVTAEGEQTDLKIRLGLQPESAVNVTVSLFSDNKTDETDEVLLETPVTFALDSTNYQSGVAMTFKGVDDHIIDGDQPYFVKLSFASEDARYSGLADKWIAGKNIDKNTAGLEKSYTETTVREDGGQLTLGIALTAKPEADVTISLAVDDDTELLVAPASIVITPETWQTPVEVTVTGVDDHIIDGDQTTRVKFHTESDDAHFSNLDDSLEITTLDDDEAALILVAAGTELMENSDKTVDIQVKLSAQPEHDVVVSAKSSDVSELMIKTGASLTFTPENWNDPQTVTLNAVDDAYADGTQSASIAFESTSEDAHFNGVKAQSPIYNILDNETATVTLTAAKTTLQPGDYATEMTVALSVQPENNVIVTIATTNDQTAYPNTTTLTFTPENWATAQKITVTDRNPQTASTAKSEETISATATGSGSYQNLKSNDVALTLYAFKSQTFKYTGDLQQVALLPGKYKLEVYGSQGVAGWAGGTAGAGGYASGEYQLTSAKTLYVCVGGNVYLGADNSASYNGGGYGHGKTGGGRGGGATHIALTKQGSGVLKNYESHKSDVLIVAGGGGGMEWAGTGGAGGGISGGTGTSVAAGSFGVAVVAKPGTQTAGGTSVAFTGKSSTLVNGGFGFGGYAYDNTTDYGAGGGSGWYGGGGTSYAGSGGGGSGYVGGVTSGTMQSGVNKDVGSAKITLLD